MTRSKTHGLAVGLMLALLLGAAPAAAFDEPSAEPGATRQVTRPLSLQELLSLGGQSPARSPQGPSQTGIRGLNEMLRRIPLRPVKIGETARLPDDPEPGVGLVVKLAF